MFPARGVRPLVGVRPPAGLRAPVACCSEPEHVDCDTRVGCTGPPSTGLSRSSSSSASRFLWWCASPNSSSRFWSSPVAKKKDELESTSARESLRSSRGDDCPPGVSPPWLGHGRVQRRPQNPKTPKPQNPVTYYYYEIQYYYGYYFYKY